MMRVAALLCLAGAALGQANSSCGPQRPSPVPDCDKGDFGSCGNACCVVDVTITGPATPTEVYITVKGFLQSGGGDGLYAYSTGPDAAGHNPSDDLRPYNVSWQYIMQGTHKTSGGYVDRLDFNFQPTADNGTVVRVGSRSGIHGALGDNGQNYKSIAWIVNTIVGPQKQVAIVHGCGKK
eukprot:TRINITY_DN18339_c0_g1_i3.p1 TRINITY_DN18339_c0_g1~~TRINITY_DN18339_c0_g1_i3.p1  ORF type:complete len:206 (+),score=76.78 TRINITY_DN18339_c0_g1_i3:81-620(+)